MNSTTDIDNINDQTTPVGLIALGIEKGLDVEKLGKLLELQERWETKESRKLFFSSLSKFQFEVPEIKKSKAVSFGAGKTSYKYAQLSDIDEAIKEPLSKNGLSKTFHINEEGNKIHVTCKISHISGYSELTTMSGNADNTGSKNAIQASGSTITYLQRYTLIGALGLTTADEDNDAVKPVENINLNKEKIEIKNVEIIKPITLNSQEIDNILLALNLITNIKNLTSFWTSNLKLKDNIKFKTAMTEKRKELEIKTKDEEESKKVMTPIIVPEYIEESPTKKKTNELLKAKGLPELI